MNNFKTNYLFSYRLLSRALLIIEKIITFSVTAYMANKLSYSDIGFWSQVLFSASLFTSLFGFNIANGLIAIVPRIETYKDKLNLIFKSGLFLFITGLVLCLILSLFRDIISNILFNNILSLNIYIIILIIGLAEMLLEFILYSYRSIQNFENSNYVLILKLIPRILLFFGVYKNDINLMLNLYSSSYIFSFLIISLKLYKTNKIDILFIIKENINKILLLEPRPHLYSLYLLSKKSVFATITASLFFFLVRSITLSTLGLEGLGEFSLAISAGATILSLTTFVGFTFYPYVSSLAIIEKKSAFKKTSKLSLKLIFISISISLTTVILKLILNDKLDFYPFTINTIDLVMAFLGYGFLAAYQISQPFAFALTNNIKIVKIEFVSSLISFGLIGLTVLGNKFSIHMALLSFCVYTSANYLQASQRNLKILNEKTI